MTPEWSGVSSLLWPPTNYTSSSTPTTSTTHPATLDYTYTHLNRYPTHIQTRVEKWRKRPGYSNSIYYDDVLQNAKHIHFPGDSKHRVVSHFYCKYATCSVYKCSLLWYVACGVCAYTLL